VGPDHNLVQIDENTGVVVVMGNDEEDNLLEDDYDSRYLMRLQIPYLHCDDGFGYQTT